MEKREHSPSEIRNMIKKYEDNLWITQYERHGIPEKYHKKWFIDYECKDAEMLIRLERIKSVQRLNKPIALLGEVGNGKTHLACCILKDAIICGAESPKRVISKYVDEHGEQKEYWGYEKQSDSGHYYTMTSLNRAYREAIANGKEDDFMEKMATMKCLVIDEIQIKSETDSQERMFQEIIDSRYANNRQTVFVGNVSVEKFKKILTKRLADRLFEQDLQVEVFNGESYRRKR